jgi:hypothetical protein
MKFRTFRNVIAMVLFLSLGGTCYGCYAWWQRSLLVEEAEKQERQRHIAEESARAEAQQKLEAATAAKNAAANAATAAAEDAARAATPGGYWLKASNLRPVDVDALTALGRPAVDKIKDAARGKPWKVNVYADDGLRFNRVKIDLDRDEKDDESWTIFADGRIERKVSSKDNGTMDGNFRLELSGWIDMRAPVATTTPASTPTSTTAAPAVAAGGRGVDTDMFDLLGRLPVQEKIKDATKGKAWKINLYSDDGQRFNRAKVDLNRNDKWDESWTFKSATDIERQVAPADDEKYTEVYSFQNGTWVKKP